MPTKTRSIRGAKAKQTKSKKAVPAKPKASRKPAAPAKRTTARKPAGAPPAPSIEALKKTISYYYLLSYCPPDQVTEFSDVTAPLRKSLADSAGMTEAAFFKAVLPEVCRRIVAYHEGTREPGKERVDALLKSAAKAEKNPENAMRFQEAMAQVARLPQRALPENRLHRKKGCQYCRLPCSYGFFTLVSEPVFSDLQKMLEAETQKPAPEQSPLRPVWGFTITHLAKTMESQQGYIHRAHLGNLAYCLLMLSMAKSRLAVPEAQLQAFQTANQAMIKED
jgi:hypothetical protein